MFGTTWGWVNDDTFFILWWTISLMCNIYNKRKDFRISILYKNYLYLKPPITLHLQRYSTAYTHTLSFDIKWSVCILWILSTLTAEGVLASFSQIKINFAALCRVIYKWRSSDCMYELLFVNWWTCSISSCSFLLKRENKPWFRATSVVKVVSEPCVPGEQ